jgi:hypothetical protein
MRATVRALHESGFLGLVESMMEAAEETAGLEAGALDADWLAPQPQSPLRRMLPEVVFGSRSLFVLTPAGKRLDAWEVRPQDTPSALDDFCDAIDRAIGSLDGDSGTPDNEWRARSLQLTDPGIDLAGDVEPSLAFDATADRDAAMALADDDARSFITDLVRSGSSITDLDDTPMSHYSSVAELYRQELIEREYLVICRQDHRTLGRVGDLDDGARQSILQLSCPTCGRRFDDELLRQVHSPSRTAAELVTAGRWRVWWAASLLVAHGIDEQAITPLAGSAGNGTALRVETLHGRLLVELPDAEFGMQHAYALIRRLRRQSVEFGLVLATEPVADEAYQYLSERVALQQGPMVSVLEGSRSIVGDLGDALDEWSIISVRSLAEELIDTIGIDIGAVIEAWMRRQGDAGDPTGEIDLRTGTGIGEGQATVTELPSVSSGH